MDRILQKLNNNHLNIYPNKIKINNYIKHNSKFLIYLLLSLI